MSEFFGKIPGSILGKFLNIFDSGLVTWQMGNLALPSKTVKMNPCVGKA